MLFEQQSLGRSEVALIAPTEIVSLSEQWVRLEEHPYVDECRCVGRMVSQSISISDQGFLDPPKLPERDSDVAMGTRPL